MTHDAQEVGELVERLRHADQHSQQRFWGSRIFDEAARAIQSLQARNAELERDVAFFREQFDDQVESRERAEAQVVSAWTTPSRRRSMHADQITDEMVDILTLATRKYTRETLLVDEHRDLIRSALTAALSAQAEPVAWQNIETPYSILTPEQYGMRLPLAAGRFRPLYATPPAPAPVVKGLEWVLIDEEWWAAETVVGGYEVRQARASARTRFPEKRQFEPFNGTVEAAKAAAQADYERREREAEALAAGRQMTYAEAVLRHAPPMNDVETCLFIIEQMADDLFNATGQVTDAESALRLAASRIREWRPA